MLGTYASSLCTRTVARGTARSAQRLGLPPRGLHAAASGNSDVDILQEWAGLKPATSGLTRQGAVDLEIGTQGVATVTLQRPEKLNAFNMQMFRDLELAFDEIESRRQEVNCVLLQGAGDQFTAGLDLSALMALQQILGGVKCPSQMREHLVSVVSRFQTIFSRPERCHAPVIAATKGLVVGAGIDLITACDLRLCEKSARMTVKEVDLAIVADLGTLQRLPHVIGEQRARELAYTGRFVSGPEAERIGLVLECLEDAESLQTRADALAREIASKSPITVRGIKANMNYSRDHTVDEGLEYVLRWNGAHLLSADLQQAAVQASKRTKNKKKAE